MSDPFLRLTDADLEALAAALRSRRLSPPFSEVAVRRSCAGEHASVATARLQELSSQGMLPDHLALLLESIAMARHGRMPEEELIDLVWTGPETPGTVNRDTGVVVRELFGQAEKSVLIAGFAIFQGREIFRGLAERMSERPDLKVRMFLDLHRRPGDVSLDSEFLRTFVVDFRKKDWPDGRTLPEIFYDPRSLDLDAEKRSSLHAKCIVVDGRVAFVTSANFTEAAQMRNIEVGVLIQSPGFATRLTNHFEGLLDSGALLTLCTYPE